MAAGDVARQPQQVGGVHLVVVAEAVGGAQQGVLDLLVQRPALFLEQPVEGPQQLLVGALRARPAVFLALDAQVGKVQVLGADQLVAADQQGVVDDVFQLADVARPVVAGQALAGVLAQADFGVAQGAGCTRR